MDKTLYIKACPLIQILHSIVDGDNKGPIWLGILFDLNFIVEKFLTFDFIVKNLLDFVVSY